MLELSSESILLAGVVPSPEQKIFNFLTVTLQLCKNHFHQLSSLLPLRDPESTSSQLRWATAAASCAVLAEVVPCRSAQYWHSWLLPIQKGRVLILYPSPPRPYWTISTFHGIVFYTYIIHYIVYSWTSGATGPRKEEHDGQRQSGRCCKPSFCPFCCHDAGS